MKKLFNLLAIAVVTMMMAFSLTSCDTTNNDGNTQTGFTYNVDIDACAKGDLMVTFPNGKLAMNGDATIMFDYSNDSVINLMAGDILTEEAILASNDQVKIDALNATNNWFDENFTVSSTSAGGKYCVKASGYIKEPVSGLVIRLSKSFPENCSCDSLK